MVHSKVIMHAFTKYFDRIRYTQICSLAMMWSSSVLWSEVVHDAGPHQCCGLREFTMLVLISAVV